MMLEKLKGMLIVSPNLGVGGGEMLNDFELLIWDFLNAPWLSDSKNIITAEWFAYCSDVESKQFWIVE